MPWMTGSCQMGQQAQGNEPAHYACAPCARAERSYTLGMACTETIADAMTSGKEGAESIRGLVRMGYAYTPICHLNTPPGRTPDRVRKGKDVEIVEDV